MTGVALPMIRGKSYSEEHGYIEKEIIIRASHTHPYFKEEKSKVYQYIEKETSTTSYAALIKPYHKKKNVRDSFLKLFPNIQVKISDRNS